MAKKNPTSTPMMRAFREQLKMAVIKNFVEGDGNHSENKGLMYVPELYRNPFQPRNLGSGRGTFHNHKSKTFKQNKRKGL